MPRLNKAAKIPIKITRVGSCKTPRRRLMKRMSVSGFTADKAYFRKNPAFIRKIKAVGALFLMLAIMVVQSFSVFGYEAHIINVTAKICNYSETRTIGYWKNHPEIYAYYLPQSLGSMIIGNEDEANDVFNFSGNARNASNKLGAQLLGMKFNIADFGIGDYMPEGDTRTLSQLITEADNILSDPDSAKEEILAMKDLLDRLNNLEKIKYCTGDLPERNTRLVINKVYYDADATTEEIVSGNLPAAETAGSAVEEDIVGLDINDALPADEIIGSDSGSVDNTENASAYVSGNSEAGAGSEAIVEESNISADNSQVSVPDPASEEIPAETPVPDILQTETEPVGTVGETAPLAAENSLESVLLSKDTGIPAASENAEASPAEAPPAPDNSAATETEPHSVEPAIDAELGV